MNCLKRELILPNFELNNRLVMPPMATSCCDEDGHVSERLLNYYNDKSQGGYLGMIITEHSYVSKEGMANPGQMSICKDSDIPGLRRLADVIHQNGSKAIIQISHAGGASRKEDTGLDSVAPSAVTLLNGREADHILTCSDIHDLVAKFAAAAQRAMEAGFDGVEIHSAHRYLLNQFYSPLTNRRTDAYGGDITGRIKLHLEIIRSVRALLGPEHVLLVRLGALDYTEGGSSIEDAVYAAKKFEENGVDILDISGGMNGFIIRGREHDQGYYTDVTAHLKKYINIPVIMTGGITDPVAAEKILREEKADLIGVGRALLKDSRWAERASQIGK